MNDFNLNGGGPRCDKRRQRASSIPAAERPRYTVVLILFRRPSQRYTSGRTNENVEQ